MWDFLFISLSDNWSAEFKCFFMTLWEARKPCEAKSKATICPALFDETLCGVLNERFFPRVAVCEFIQMNWRSASFECWVYHFELNNPLSACISYSNKSMKREIWKLNLELNRMCDFVVYCFCLAFNIPLPVSTRKDKYYLKSYRTIQAKFSWWEHLYAEVGLERLRARITRHEQGTL